MGKSAQSTRRQVLAGLLAMGAGAARVEGGPADRRAPARSRGGIKPFEWHARRLSQVIVARHSPYGTIIDPVFESPQSDVIAGYSRAGDSAIWTGHYLAAEAFRFRVTGSEDALANMRRALAGIRTLVDVTGTDLLARVLVPADSPFAEGILEEEGRHGVFSAKLQGREYYWIGNTSRDQYLGVFFGLSAAYEMAPIPDMQDEIRNLVTRLLGFLLNRDWTVVMPNGDFSTVFVHRPDQQLGLLQVGRQVDPERFARTYSQSRAVLSFLAAAPLAVEALDDHDAYFKFNLAMITLYSLIRLEDSGWHRGRYLDGYDLIRNATRTHGNAHFNLIDRALKGPNRLRDAETRTLLEAWLRRPLRDPFIDLRGTVPACGEERACEPLPVEDRVRTDFLWQRSPFLLFGGGTGRIESAGIDFILPYWMGRFYQVL